MGIWREASDEAFPIWICDLDPQLAQLSHRRLCVWQDELDGGWRWEIETFHGTGEESAGISASREAAMADAETAAGLASAAQPNA